MFSNRAFLATILALLLFVVPAEAGSKQQCVGVITSAASNTQVYFPLFQCGWPSTDVVESDNLARMPVGGVLRNLKVHAFTAQVGADTITVAIRVNGSDSALSITITSASAAGTDTDNVTVAENDTVSLGRVGTNTPVGTQIAVSFEFEATVVNTFVHGFGGAGDIWSVNQFDQIFGGGGITSANESSGAPSAVAGQLTETCVALTTAPGAGTSRIFTVYKNGTAQDGSAGTPDTRLTISNTDTTGCATYTVTVAIGDRMSMNCTESGAATNSSGGGTVVFVSDTPHTFNFASSGGATPSAGLTSYNYVGGDTSTGAWQPTENTRQTEAPITAMTLSGLRVIIITAPGVGKQWVFTFRKNTAATAAVVTITDANTTGTDADSITTTEGDLLSWEAVPTGTPANTSYTWFVFAATTTGTGGHGMALTGVGDN